MHFYLAKLTTNCFHYISGLFRLYLGKIVLVETHPSLRWPPTAFHSFFTKVTNIHKYNTRLAAKQSYFLPFVRTNYGKFNIQFQGLSIWNCTDKDIKSSSKAMFSSIFLFIAIIIIVFIFLLLYFIFYI